MQHCVYYGKSALKYVRGVARIFWWGGMKFDGPSEARRVEGAKRLSQTRGVRGHAPPENFAKMEAKWCILESILAFC